MIFLKEYNNYQWDKWTYNSNHGIGYLKKSQNPIPPKYGVYIIKAYKEIPRTNGKSNVIYIGQSGGGAKAGKQGIGPLGASTGRLFNTRGFDEWVRIKIEKMMPNELFILECYFTNKNEDPKAIEKKLLKAYAEEYFELPPANNQSFDYK